MGKKCIIKPIINPNIPEKIIIKYQYDKYLYNNMIVVLIIAKNAVNFCALFREYIDNISPKNDEIFINRKKMPKCIDEDMINNILIQQMINKKYDL